MDTTKLDKIKKILNQTKSNKLKIIPKFGLSSFTQKTEGNF